jgi:hypothetical protein
MKSTRTGSLSMIRSHTRSRSSYSRYTALCIRITATYHRFRQTWDGEPGVRVSRDESSLGRIGTEILPARSQSSYLHKDHN